MDEEFTVMMLNGNEPGSSNTIEHEGTSEGVVAAKFEEMLMYVRNVQDETQMVDDNSQIVVDNSQMVVDNSQIVVDNSQIIDHNSHIVDGNSQMVTADGLQMVVDNSQIMIIGNSQMTMVGDSQNNSMSCDNFIQFKDDDPDDPDCVPLNSNGEQPATEIIDTNSEHASLLGSAANDCDSPLNNEEVKAVNIPDNWQISILEDNGDVSYSAEPLITSEHSVYQLWECPKCTALFRDKNVCENHVTKAHDFSCSLCSEPFDEKCALENHIVDHISEVRGLGSPTASKSSVPSDTDIKPAVTFPDKFSMSSKKRKLHDEPSPKTESLVLKSEKVGHSSKSSLKSFKQVPVADVKPNTTLTKDSQYMCDICGKECYTQHSFLMHLTKRHSETWQYEFTCDICKEGFMSKYAFSDHLTTKHGESENVPAAGTGTIFPQVSKPMTPYTPRTYVPVVGLGAINSQVSRPTYASKTARPKNFRCHICDERFCSSSLLKDHNRMHEDVYPFPCDFCGEKYKMSAGLLNHIKVNHPNGREFPCVECEKSFRSKMYLEVHVSEVHASERKKCRYCPKTYKSYDALLTHIQEVHGREESKNNDCDYCSQSFATSRDLKRHMEIHLMTIQTYDCDTCAQTFATASELYRHNMQEHKPRQFDCEWCSRSFGHKENLRVHIKVHHRPMYVEND